MNTLNIRYVPENESEVKRYAIVDEKGNVVNVCLWDGKSDWQPSDGHYVIQHDNCDIGDKWDSKEQKLIKADRSVKV